jgi:hypothetical protein
MNQTKKSMNKGVAVLLGVGLIACTPNENPAKSPEVARSESREDMNRTLDEASDKADAHLEEMQDETRKALAGEQTEEPKTDQTDQEQADKKQSEDPVATSTTGGSDEQKQPGKPKQKEAPKE